MTPKERVLTALAHTEPDRLPLDLWLTPEVEKVLMGEAGTGDPFEMRVRMGHDLLMPFIGIVNSFYMSEEDEYTDPWGIKFRSVEYAHGKGRYTEMVNHPLAGDDGSLLDSYKSPDPEEAEQYFETAQLIEKYGKTHCIVGGVLGSVFEGAWYLRSMPRFLQDMLSNKDYAHRLMDTVMEFHKKAGVKLINMGCDMILAGDDVGTQDRMLISPGLWREFIKPRYGALFRAYRTANPDVKIATHICGHIEPIIDDLVEVGVDVLNPVQPTAMDPGRLKKRFGSRLSFWGGVDDQKILPFGSPKEVENEVKLRIRQIAPGGGYILCSSHNVQAETPVENIRAYFSAYKKFGSYPIRI